MWSWSQRSLILKYLVQLPLPLQNKDSKGEEEDKEEVADAKDAEESV